MIDISLDMFDHEPDEPMICPVCKRGTFFKEMILARSGELICPKCYASAKFGRIEMEGFRCESSVTTGNELG